eukprot:scaffold23941_cov42-Cyclotella_meneghiniana.AAC.5
MDGLVEVIQKSTNLRHLELAHCFSFISDLSREFFDALANNRTIKILNFERINDREAKCLADALRANTTIEELYLSCRRTSNAAFQCLTDSFKVNRGIRSLHLIGNFRMADLADSLKVNKTLFVVRLSSFGNMDNECVKSLADAIVVNRSLDMISLNISPKPLYQIGVEEWTVLMSAVTKNGSIKFSLYDGQRDKDYPSLVTWLVEISKSYNNEIDKKNKEIASLKSERIASLQSEIEIKNKQIISLKSAIRGAMEQLNMILEPIDLTGDGKSEPPAKRPRNGMPATKSNLSIMHEQNQKMIKVKIEKNDAEANLKTVTEEKNCTKAELEDTREDLDIANETVQQQALATDIWQRKFDELAALVAAGKVDGAAVAAIRNRSLAHKH